MVARGSWFFAVACAVPFLPVRELPGWIIIGIAFISMEDQPPCATGHQRTL